jgi:hypothetical protein
MIQNRRLLGVAASVFLAGCAETTNSPKPATSAAAAEYEYVTPLGSNIPVRVPKGQTAVNQISPTEVTSGERAANMIHSAGGAAPIDRGR